jgi:hypothetical protein
MQKISWVVFFLLLNVGYCAAAEDSTEVKVRKLEYSDFIANYSINDTSNTVIDIFFDKRNNTAKGQLSFFPITAAIFPLVPVISVGLSIVTFPMFINGSVVWIKYRKKKLQKVLINYKETHELPNWIRKKVNKSLEKGQFDYE